MMGCNKCKTLCGLLVLAAGVLFLLVDLGIWDFWGVRWWSVLMVIWGAGIIGGTTCPECQILYRRK